MTARWPGIKGLGLWPAANASTALALWLALWLSGCTHAPHTSDPTRPPADWSWLAPGLRYATASPWPDSRVHVVQLDLREPGLRLQVSSESQRGLPMGQLAPGEQALVSVNASFFGRGYVPRGHTVSDGQAWAGALLPQSSPLLECDRAQRCQIVFLPDPAPPPRGYNVVAGTPWLLQAGKPRQSSDDKSCAALCDQTHPRTALGLDASGRWLSLVLVEGRRGTVAGVRLAPLAQWMTSLGVHEAINLDGGGSSSLWLRGVAVMNRPFNEPAERALANALHILQLRPAGLGEGEQPDR